MQIVTIQWTRVIVGILLAEVVLIAAAYAWVAYYSHVLNPNQPFAIYQAYAMRSGPWVSIVIGIPLFLTLGRWLARNLATALSIAIGYVVLDGAILWLLSTPEAKLAAWLICTSYATKIGAAFIGNHARARVAPS